MLPKFKLSMKVRILETCICHCELDNFQIVKDVPDELSDINEVFLILYNEVWQHLKDMNNSVN